MTIRKHGSVTGRITGVEDGYPYPEGEAASDMVLGNADARLREQAAEHIASLPPSIRQAALDSQREYRERHWSPDDERELADENDRSDRPGA